MLVRIRRVGIGVRAYSVEVNGKVVFTASEEAMLDYIHRLVYDNIVELIEVYTRDI